MVYLDLNGSFWVVLKIVKKKMATLWFVLDFNGSLGLVIVDFG